MRYCKKCLTTDLRPNAKFYDSICVACDYSDREIDRSEVRLKKLERWLRDSQRNRKHSSNYDCVVGVSGGKDSTRQALWVRDRLGLKPLLVCVAYPPRQMSHTGSRNIENLLKLGFDILMNTPAPQLARDLSRKSFYSHGNVCSSTEMALFSGVPRVAIEYKIPLIFWGENPALQVGDASTEGIDELDGNNLRQLNTLQSSKADWFLNVEPIKSKNYEYPTVDLFEKQRLQIIYLGPAWNNWSTDTNAALAALNGLHLRPNERYITGDISEASMVDEEFTNINMMLKYFKFGFGRATDLVNEQIRSGKLSREAAIELVKSFDGICDDRIICRYCDYISITYEEFWRVAHSYVNWDIFRPGTSGPRPLPRFSVGEDFHYTNEPA